MLAPDLANRNVVDAAYDLLSTLHAPTFRRRRGRECFQERRAQGLAASESPEHARKVFCCVGAAGVSIALSRHRIAYRRRRQIGRPGAALAESGKRLFNVELKSKASKKTQHSNRTASSVSIRCHNKSARAEPYNSRCCYRRDTIVVRSRSVITYTGSPTVCAAAGRSMIYLPCVPSLKSTVTMGGPPLAVVTTPPLPELDPTAV
jgi:hypothetical protein